MRTLLYLTTAIVLGVLATLTPLFVLELVHQEQYGSAQLFGGFRSLEKASSPSNQSQSYFSDFAVLTVSFVIAILLFLFVRHSSARFFTTEISTVLGFVPRFDKRTKEPYCRRLIIVKLGFQKESYFLNSPFCCFRHVLSRRGFDAIETFSVRSKPS